MTAAQLRDNVLAWVADRRQELARKGVDVTATLVRDSLVIKAENFAGIPAARSAVHQTCTIPNLITLTRPDPETGACRTAKEVVLAVANELVSELLLHRDNVEAYEHVV